MIDVTRLQTISSQLYAFQKLSRDDYWKKMNADERSYYFTESIALGERAATLFLETHNGLPMSKIREKYRLRLKKDSHHAQLEVLDLHPDIDLESRIITMNPRATLFLEDLFKKTNLTVSRDTIITFLFFRAFYHLYAREVDLLPTQVLKPLDYRRLGLFPSQEIIKNTDGIAADIFAQRISQLPIHSGLISYLKLIFDGKVSEEDVYNHLKKEEDDFENGNWH